jgi:hypothetical protein
VLCLEAGDVDKVSQSKPYRGAVAENRGMGLPQVEWKN